MAAAASADYDVTGRRRRRIMRTVTAGAANEATPPVLGHTGGVGHKKDMVTDWRRVTALPTAELLMNVIAI